MTQANSYEIIIVGAGTSGCVLANRLSAIPNVSILVLEAGEDHSRDEQVYTPGLCVKLLGDPDRDWQFASKPNAGINGRSIKHPRGKLIGGTSAINSFALIYPNSASLDSWAGLGNKGWDWEGMKKYYRRFQTIVPPSEEVRNALSIQHCNEAIEASNGPIRASFPLTAGRLQKDWVQTFRNLGLENTKDALDGEALGGYISTNHIANGERSHAGVAYLDPVKGRRSLHVVTGAFVQRVIFHEAKQSGQLMAKGVEYMQGGEVMTAIAGKEVILCGGAFASPQILELSGIGNPDVLNQHGIDVLHANPAVGENLQDHIKGVLSFEAADDLPIVPAPLEVARKQYEKDRTGPWAENACYTFAYMPMQQFLSDEDKQDLRCALEKHLNAGSQTVFEKQRNNFIRKMIESPDEATATAFLSRRAAAPDPEGRQWVTLNAMLSHSFSSGSVHIQSSNPAIKPKVDFQYYSHPLDILIHAYHLKALEKLATVEPLASAMKAGGDRLPAGLDAKTLDDAKEVLREYTTTNYHPVGTCSMMPEEMGGVVDARLKVYGAQNVRVVDASIMPIIPRGNVITTVYAVAEKAADIIREDLGVTCT